MVTQERAIRTRRALLQAAAAMFHERGFAQATLGAISGSAEVSSGALHFHFGSKAALATAVENEASHALVRLITVIQYRLDSPLQILVDSVRALAARLRDDDYLRAGLHLSHDATWPGRLRLRDQWNDYVLCLLTAADTRGDLAEGVAPQDAARLVSAATSGLEALSGDDPGWLSPDVLTAMWQLLLPALASPAALARIRPAGVWRGMVDTELPVAPVR